MPNKLRQRKRNNLQCANAVPNGIGDTLFYPVSIPVTNHHQQSPDGDGERDKPDSEEVKANAAAIERILISQALRKLKKPAHLKRVPAKKLALSAARSRWTPLLASIEILDIVTKTNPKNPPGFITNALRDAPELGPMTVSPETASKLIRAGFIMKLCGCSVDGWNIGWNDELILTRLDNSSDKREFRIPGAKLAAPLFGFEENAPPLELDAINEALEKIQTSPPGPIPVTPVIEVQALLLENETPPRELTRLDKCRIAAGAAAEEIRRYDGFESFWSAYPNTCTKTGKQVCLDLWISLGLAEKKWRVMEGLQNWKSSSRWTKNNGEFVPKPEKWLKDEAWAVPFESFPKDDDSPWAKEVRLTSEECDKLLNGE